jgi:hypothetical protein
MMNRLLMAFALSAAVLTSAHALPVAVSDSGAAATMRRGAAPGDVPPQTPPHGQTRIPNDVPPQTPPHEATP